MKNLKKFLGVLLALVMALAMGVAASASGTGTITITNAVAGNTYTLYKVFDADGDGTNISYKLVSGKTEAPAGFTVDEAGNVTYTGSSTDGALTTNDIAAIKAYVEGDAAVDTKTATGTTVTFENLPNGYYYISTTTGTVVTISSTNPDASVTDKNEVPQVDKKITSATSKDADGKKALAEVGSTVSYEADITVGKGAVKYVFQDTMTNQKLDSASVKVKVNNTEITTGASTYTVNAEDASLSISFADAWIASQVGKKVVITYNTTITSAALTEDEATNTAKVDYGNNSGTSSTTSGTEIHNATITVTKTDGNNEALAGAGFVLKNASGKYYKLENSVLSWVDSIDDATEYKTTEGESGNVLNFTGLAAGEYTLVEKTVPAGYNRAKDEKITVAAGNYETTNLSQSKTIVNQAGASLPTTGGIGTTIFYVVGAILALGAGVILVARRRMGE